MSTTLTPNMSLPVPGVGTEQGPDYATDVNNCLTLIDAHDHSPGYGTPISPAGMLISSDLSFVGNNATNVKTVRFNPQSTAPASPSDLGCLFEVGADLYYTDGVGNVVRITQSGAIAGTPGSISNLVSPASASYSSAAKTFTWQSDALTPANMDFAAATFRNLTASSFGMTVQPPSLSSDVTVTLPQIPGSTLPVSIDPSGVMSAAQVTLSQLSAQVQAALAAAALASPTGSMAPYGGASAPGGWLLCDGSAVSRTTYSALYAIIANAYGAGDGTTTFNLPDLRGRFIRGVDGSAGRDPDASSRTASNTGGNTGNAIGSVQSYAITDHQHSVGIGTGSNLGVPASFAGSPTSFYTGGAINTQVSTETRPINIYCNYIVKT